MGVTTFADRTRGGPIRCVRMERRETPWSEQFREHTTSASSWTHQNLT